MDFSRRAAVGLMAAPLIARPIPVLAQDRGCAILAGIKGRAQIERVNAAVWAATTAPLMKPQVAAQLAEFEEALDKAQAAANAQEIDEYLTMVNVAGTLVFAILSTGIVPVAAPTFILGSIAFTDTMWLAGPLLGGQAPSAGQFVGEYAIDRAGVVLEAMGDEASALSVRSQAISRLAGAALAWGSLVYQSWKLVDAQAKYNDLLARRNEASRLLQEFRDSLPELQDPVAAARLREQSIQYLIEDIDQALAQGCVPIPAP